MINSKPRFFMPQKVFFRSHGSIWCYYYNYTSLYALRLLTIIRFTIVNQKDGSTKPVDLEYYYYVALNLKYRVTHFSLVLRQLACHMTTARREKTP